EVASTGLNSSSRRKNSSTSAASRAEASGAGADADGCARSPSAGCSGPPQPRSRKSDTRPQIVRMSFMRRILLVDERPPRFSRSLQPVVFVEHAPERLVIDQIGRAHV